MASRLALLLASLCVRAAGDAPELLSRAVALFGLAVRLQFGLLKLAVEELELVWRDLDVAAPCAAGWLPAHAECSARRGSRASSGLQAVLIAFS
jgi:hypothetical protein